MFAARKVSCEDKVMYGDLKGIHKNEYNEVTLEWVEAGICTRRYERNAGKCGWLKTRKIPCCGASVHVWAALGWMPQSGGKISTTIISGVWEFW